MNFNYTYLENRSGGEIRKLSLFAFAISLGMHNLYDDNDSEEYRQALKDTCYKMCKLLELEGLPINRTPLTADWLDSNERKDLRRNGAIK